MRDAQSVFSGGCAPSSEAQVGSSSRIFYWPECPWQHVRAFVAKNHNHAVLRVLVLVKAVVQR